MLPVLNVPKWCFTTLRDLLLLEMPVLIYTYSCVYLERYKLFRRILYLCVSFQRFCTKIWFVLYLNTCMVSNLCFIREYVDNVKGNTVLLCENSWWLILCTVVYRYTYHRYDDCYKMYRYKPSEQCKQYNTKWWYSFLKFLSFNWMQFCVFTSVYNLIWMWKEVTVYQTAARIINSSEYVMTNKLRRKPYRPSYERAKTTKPFFYCILSKYEI